MPRYGRGAAHTAPRRSSRSLGLDAGTSTSRLWRLGRGPIVEAMTPRPAARMRKSRAEAAPKLVELSRETVRSQLPTGWRKGGFVLAVTVPSTAGSVTRRAVEVAARSLNGDRPVLLMDAPLAAAAGSGLDFTGDTAHLLLDIGVNSCEAAILGDGRVLDARSGRTGCRDIELSVLGYLYERYGILAAPYAARCALLLGSAVGLRATEERAVSVTVDRAEVEAEIARPVGEIVGTVRQLLRTDTARRHHLDPSVAGVTVVGGGAQLSPVLGTLACELAAPVTAAPDPRRAAIRGLALLLQVVERHPHLWDAR